MRLSLLPLLLVACDEDAGDTGKDTGDADAPACVQDDDCGEGLICIEGNCVGGDRNDGPDAATPLPQDEPLDAEINPPGDEDWYEIVSTGAQFATVATTDAEDVEVLDTVVSVYDAAGGLIAWEDEHPAGRIGGGYDSMVFAWFPTPGTYYVKVEDRGHFDGGTGLGGPDADYTVVSGLQDPPNEPDSLQDAALDFGPTIADVWYGTQAVLEVAGDVDYATFQVPATGMPVYVAAAQRVDSSAATPRVSLYDAEGTLVLSMVDPDAEGDMGWLPATRSDTYVVAVDDASGAGSADHWAVGFFLLRDADEANPDEAEPNDATDVATPVTMVDEAPDIGERWSGFGQGLLETADDVDVFAFDVAFADAYVNVALGAQAYGGFLVARVEVLDLAGDVLATADGTPGADPDLAELGPLPAGTYYARVSAAPESPATGGAADWYAFGVHASSTPAAE